MSKVYRLVGGDISKKVGFVPKTDLIDDLDDLLYEYKRAQVLLMECIVNYNTNALKEGLYPINPDQVGFDIDIQSSRNNFRKFDYDDITDEDAFRDCMRHVDEYWILFEKANAAYRIRNEKTHS